MSFDSLKRRVSRRLEEGAGGDHGWWIITRVHLSAARLRSLAVYLADAGFESPRDLTEVDYSALARAAEVTSEDPGVLLRRHFLLAMDTPLRLMEREDGRRWRRIQLTARGLALANEQDTAAVFEHVLGDIRFCREPWYKPTRVDKYSDFDIHPYEASLRVMSNSDGWIDRDEYELFVSRLRNEDEIPWAVDCVGEFRLLEERHRKLLLEDVRDKFPTDKTYQNWRDMSIHTFSLFSLGTSALRVDRELRLLDRALLQPAAPKPTRAPVAEHALGTPSSERLPMPLRPPLATPSELVTPPVAPIANSGTDAELLVGKMLEADGWRVVYYSHRRGFGFDIWAQRAEQAVLVEVKSAVKSASTVTLTRLEYEAAQQYSANYVLAIVERLGTSSPVIHYISDPAAVLTITESISPEYRVARTSWEPAAASQLA